MPKKPKGKRIGVTVSKEQYAIIKELVRSGVHKDPQDFLLKAIGNQLKRDQAVPIPMDKRKSQPGEND